LQPVSSLGGGRELFYGSFWLVSQGGAPNDFTVLWNGVDVSLLLLGTGMAGIIGVIRRKMNR
jgi:hypothetical protein